MNAQASHIASFRSDHTAKIPMILVVAMTQINRRKINPSPAQYFSLDRSAVSGDFVDVGDGRLKMLIWSANQIARP